MTQQPYYPPAPQPQYPVAPTQPQVQYPQQPPAPAYPQQYGQPYLAQQFPQAAPQQPTVPLAQGNLDDYYAQPSASGGPSISWSVNGQQKPIGTFYEGIVARDVTNADIQQQTDPSTGQPKFYRDGRPQFVMKVPLKVVPSAEYPEGEATWFVRGQSRDELVRAMSEAGCSGAPRGGAAIRVTLVQRRPSRMGNPANVVQVQYHPGPGEAANQATGATSPAPAAAQQPVQEQQYQQPVQGQQYQQPAPPQGYEQQAPLAPAQPAPPVQQFQQPAQAAPPMQYQAPAAAQPQFQQAPQQVQQQAPQGQLPPPAGLSQEQQDLLARITGGQQPAA